jgi:hypothetical protein
MSDAEQQAGRTDGRIAAEDNSGAVTRAPLAYPDGATQIFTADGRTAFTENGATSRGEWGVTASGRFWSFWPPEYRAEYDVFRIMNGDENIGVRFVDNTSGATSDGRYTLDTTETSR